MNPETVINTVRPKNNPQIWKLFIIGFLIALLMIPTVWISFIVNERYQRKQSVVDEIAGKWGSSQIISGPVICIPYTVQTRGSAVVNEGKAIPMAVADDKMITVTKYLYLAPDSLAVSGTVNTVMHKRGIFKVTGYKAKLNLRATLNKAILDNPLYLELPLDWNAAVLAFDVFDQRGLKEISGTVNNAPLIFNQAQGVLSVSSLPETNTLKNTISGFRGDTKEQKSIDFKLASPLKVDCRNQRLDMEIQLSITGTQQLSFASTALAEKVSLDGDWPSPSFVGDMLPESRTVNTQGFQATWLANKLSSGIKKMWSSDEPTVQLSNLGVDFLIMVDSYQQTTRALKYSVLFLLLTFMTFFFAETVTNQRIHPIQYLMVGFSLMVFYLLLLSISERRTFSWAYLIAASAIVLQITLYCHSILKTRRFALQAGAMLVFLYTFLFVLLRLQDSALLIGSISLFLLLSLAMYVIRNINWYNQG